MDQMHVRDVRPEQRTALGLACPKVLCSLGFLLAPRPRRLATPNRVENVSYAPNFHSLRMPDFPLLQNERFESVRSGVLVDSRSFSMVLTSHFWSEHKPQENSHRSPSPSPSKQGYPMFPSLPTHHSPVSGRQEVVLGGGRAKRWGRRTVTRAPSPRSQPPAPSSGAS